MLSDKEMPVKRNYRALLHDADCRLQASPNSGEAGLVQDRKVGRETRYRLDAEPLGLKDWLAYFDRFWENKLSMLKYYVEDQEDNPKNDK